MKTPTQTSPDYFYSKPEQLTRQNTNERYKFFRQNYFTAGDYEQFLEHWDASPVTQKPVPSRYEQMKDFLPEAIDWEGYKTSCVLHIFNTYMYISEKFKKGLFMKTRKNSLDVFLPFSKVNFTNEWFGHIHIDTKKYASIQDLMRFVASQEDKPFVESRVHKDIKSWYGNNGLVRLEFPISEGDSGCNMLKDMFESLAKERDIPDVSFFVNKRDFPLLTKNGTEAYTSFFGTHVNLVSHQYTKFTPILGMTTSDVYADIPIPTWEDWCRVSYWHDKRMFAKEFHTYPTPEEFESISWEEKRPTAVFRGTSTGLGTKLHNNPRLFFSAESAKGKMDSDNIPFLDVGITRWNLRPRKHPNCRYLDTIRLKEMPFDLVEPLTPLEQARFKYILHLPGHSCAYRLSLELFSGSVVLLYPCEYKLWFSGWLVPWKHYVPIDPKNPHDVYEKIKWCKKNDGKCKKIAREAKYFAKKYLCREFLLDYLQAVLWALVQKNGYSSYALHSMDSLAIQKVQSRVDVWKTEILEIVKTFDSFFLQEPENLAQSLVTPSIVHHLVQDPLFFQNITMKMMTETKCTRIYKFEYKGYSLAYKVSKKMWKNNQMRPFFFSLCALNNLANKIPNFVHCYWCWEEQDEHWITIMDFVEGKTLEHFVKEKKTSLQDIINIWLMVTLALHAAQQETGFLHMDLYPWNIIVKHYDQPIEITYPISIEESMTISTQFVPVIIDYEKSHFVHDGIHYYNSSPFHFCRIQDILSLVFSVLYIFLEHVQLSKDETAQVLKIMNFFSSEYTNHSHFYTLSHVKLFLKRHKKFSKMLYEQKHGLEHKKPLDFFHYLVSMQQNGNFFYRRIARQQNRFVPMPWSVYKINIEFEILRSLMSRQDKTLLEKENVLRQYWLAFCKSHPSYQYFLLAPQVIQRLQVLESIIGKKLWNHLDWKDFVPCDNMMNVSDTVKKWFSTSFSSLDKPQIMPFLTSHLCQTCIKKMTTKKGSLTMEEFQQLLYVVPLENIPKDTDFFIIWTQAFQFQFLEFLQGSMDGHEMLFHDP